MSDTGSATLWRRSRDLAAEALDLDPAERHRWLASRGSEDPEVLREVARLLDLDARADRFLDRPAVDLHGPERRPAFDVGDRVGAWELVARLGEGGGGTVFQAIRHEPYRQRVAIKISHTAGMGSQRLARFHRERQILARLEHPSIARILDGGSLDGSLDRETGAPYLVMELVEGLPMDRFCDHGELGLRDRLDLFLQVCDAVAYAHRRFVIHGDLKPANILVGEDGRPRLLDFGVSELLRNESDEDSDDVPSASAGPGGFTPSHASPEQLRGEPITVATDVYALGVLLYETLTGRLPREIAELDAQRIDHALACRPPSVEGFRLSAGKRPGRDLDAILARALEVEEAQRYRSVDELADEVRRHLARRPVRARGSSWTYRAGRLVQRHRLVAAATATILMLVLALTVNWIRSSVEIARERDQARGERDRAQATVAFLTGLLGAANPADPAHGSGRRMTVETLLEQAAEKARQELEEPEDRAAILHTLGTIQHSHGRLATAEELLEEAERTWRSIPEREPPRSEIRRAETLYWLGIVRMQRGRYGPAAHALRSALELRQRFAGPRHRQVGETLRDLASLEIQLGRYPKARAMADEVLAIYRDADAPPTTVADGLCLLAAVEDLLGRPAEAERHFREALALEETALGADSIAAATTGLLLLRPLMALQPDSPELDALIARAESVYLQAFGAESRRLWTVREMRGRLHLARGEARAAERELRQALSHAPVSVPAHVAGRLFLGQALVAQGRWDEAEEELNRSLELAQPLPLQHPWRARALAALAEVALARGDFDTALAHAREALRIRREALPEDHPLQSRSEELVERVVARAAESHA